MIQPPAGVLGWLPPQFWRTRKEFYVYGVDFLPVPSLGTLSSGFTIQSDTDFIMLSAMVVATATDNITPLAFRPALVEIKDNSTGSSITQIPVHVEAFFGDARYPGVFQIPYFVKATSSIAVTIQNLEANARNYRLYFGGFRSRPNSDIFSDKM